MRTVSIRLIDLQVMKINLGFVGENEHTRVLIDCKKAFDQYPGAVPSLTVIPPQGDPYPAIVSRDGDIVSWNVTNSDLVYDGEGQIQLSFTQDNVVMKTYIGRTTIDKSILPSGEAPTPIQNWLDDANVALAEIPITITTALQEAKDSGEFDGFSPTVNIEDIAGGHEVTITTKEGSNTFNVMDGLRGPQGESGADGFSPTVSIVTMADGHAVNITDRAGIHSFEVLDGRDGAPGQDGANGFSPTVTVQDIERGHRLTVTDVNGPHIFDVINGSTVVKKLAVAPKTYGYTSVEFNDGAENISIDNDFCIKMSSVINKYMSIVYPGNVTANSFSECVIVHSYGDKNSPTTVRYPIQFPVAAGQVYTAEIYPLQGKLYVTSALLTLNTANMDYEIDDDSDYAQPGWQNSGVKALVGDNCWEYIYSTNIGNYCIANTYNDNDIIMLPKSVYGYTGRQLIEKAIDVQIIVPLAEPIEYNFTPLSISTKSGYNSFFVSNDGSYYNVQYVGFSFIYTADLELYQFEDYAAKNDTVLNTTLSINRNQSGAIGDHSVSIGNQNTASGENSIAFGVYTVSSGENSISSGYYTYAIGNQSFTGGAQARAEGVYSFAYGYGAQAMGDGSVAHGYYSRAEGNYSLAGGYSSYAKGESSIAFGNGAITRGPGSIANGTANANGQYSAAFGSHAHANGSSSVAIGLDSLTYGFASLAAGATTVASGMATAVFGRQNVIDAPYTYEEWQPNTQYHAGDHVKITVDLGEENISVNGYRCVQDNIQDTFVTARWMWDEDEGRYVKQEYWVDDYYGQHALIVGNGEGYYYDSNIGETIYTRSNAFSVDWNGDVHAQGTIYAGCDADSTGGSPLIKLSDIWAGPSTPKGQYALEIGMGTKATGSGSFAGGAGARAIGDNSIAFGGGATASGHGSIALGGGATASGYGAMALGAGVQAHGDYSFAVGGGSRAYGQTSFASGGSTQARGICSAAFGGYTRADGDYSFVVGKDNYIEERTYNPWQPNRVYEVNDQVKVTDSNGANEFYECLVEHTSGEEFEEYSNDPYTHLWNRVNGSFYNYLFVVGNGTNSTDADRSNAFSVDLDGNGYFKNDVYIHCLRDGSGGEKVATAYNTVITNSLSMGRKANTSIGYRSVALGSEVIADGYYSVALGSQAEATGHYSFAVGSGARATISNAIALGAAAGAHGYGAVAIGSYATADLNSCVAIGYQSHAIKDESFAFGQQAIAREYNSYAIGRNAETNARNAYAFGYNAYAGAEDSVAFGPYNVSDGYDMYDEWESNHTYHPGDRIKVTTTHVSSTMHGDVTVTNIMAYECKTENTSSAQAFSTDVNGQRCWKTIGRNNFAFIFGNGIEPYYDFELEENVGGRSNALAIEWNGTGRFGGDLYVNCNTDSTGGSKVLDTTLLGIANGVATLDANGKIPSAQLPSYVDDVVNGYLNNGVFYEDQQHQHAITAESNKIYVDLYTELAYRWSGVAYVEISPSIALGTTSSTAFRGDLGQIAHSHATDASRSTTAHVSGLYKIATTAEGHVASVTAVTKSDITALGIPGDQPDISVKVDKVALDNAGITSRTYVPLFGGEFEVTTAIRENKTVPYGRAGVLGRAHKENKHRVTINGTQYILPCQLCFTNTGLYEYIGNIDLADDYVGAENTLNEKFNVPFFILFDDSNGQHIDLWTETAGTYTVLIERIDIEKNKIPNSLIYDIEYSPIQIKNVTGSGQDPISIGVNGMVKGDMSTIGGNIAIGYGNVASGMSNYLIGNTNYTEGGINSALGMGNAVYNGTEMLQGSAVIGTANVVMSPYSYAFGRSNSIARNGRYNIALGTFNNMYDGAEGSAVLGGYNHVAGAAYSNFTLGNNLENHSACSTVMGVSNFIDNTDFPRWVANTSYSVGDRVFNNKIGYQCSTANSDATFDESKWIAIMCSSKRALVVGNGGSTMRSNAFALDWNGDIHIMGKVYTDSSYDSTGGSRLISVSEIATASETQAIINEYGVVS